MEIPSNDDGAFLAAAMQLSVEKRNEQLQILKNEHICSKGYRCPVKFSSFVHTSDIETHTIQFTLPAYKEESIILRNTEEIRIVSTFLGMTGSIICPCKNDCGKHLIQTICNICCK